MAKVNFNQVDEGIPAFLALILIPFTYSITQGISWALIAYVLLKLMRGKAREIPVTIYWIAGLAGVVLLLI
ncbi:MAG: hypothetical protein LGR52_11065 [Candidatus Thiosymbion ectosymbiont of Robbea hypermnestra]|nr:hypothetical protein [Candidatus Thiosymbion ectosymbiont of Robbea hypermnestra]